MRALFLLGLLLTGVLAGRADAQDGFVAQTGSSLSYNVFDRNGRTFINPAPDVAGTPFYSEEWRIGTLVVMDNRRYDSVKLRLNLQSGEVHLLDSNGKEIALAKGYIKEVYWPGKVRGIPGGTRFQNGFPTVDEQDAYSYYEVLSKGKFWLLHSIRKVISQRKDDLSGEIRREYQTYEEYYVCDGKTMQRVKKDKAFILATLSDKRDSIEAFIEKNKLKLKSIDDIRQTIDYYNTL
jgi:hypothetical protein